MDINTFLRHIKNTVAKAHPLTSILSSPEGQQYVADVSRMGGQAVSGAVQQAPPVQLLQRILNPNQEEAQRQSQEGINTFMSALGAAYRLTPTTPLMGALFGAIQGERKLGEQYVQGESLTDIPEFLTQSMAKGMINQPFAGEALTDNPKAQRAINLITMLGMTAKGGYDAMKSKQAQKMNLYNQQPIDIIVKENKAGIEPGMYPNLSRQDAQDWIAFMNDQKVPIEISTSSLRSTPQNAMGIVGAKSSPTGVGGDIAKAKASGQSFDEWVKGQGEGDYGTVREWGTRNQYVAKNPFRGQLDAMKKTKKYDMEVLKDAERWEMEQVLKDKPSFLSDNLSKEEISAFAKKNKLWFRSKGDSMVVAKDIDSLNRTLNALTDGNQRQLGLSLGYEDLGMPKTRSQLKAEWDKVGGEIGGKEEKLKNLLQDYFK